MTALGQKMTVEHGEEFSFLTSNGATNVKLSSNLRIIGATISVKLDALWV